MTTKERVISAWEGRSSDYIPLTTWCFGLNVPKEIQWKNNGIDVEYWYSNRMEHLHTLPFKWKLQDDFNRSLAWQKLGLDDIHDVSVPWGTNPDVTWKDSRIDPSIDEKYPVMIREYSTPSGTVSHAVRETAEDMEEGWVIQPDHVPLIEDYNIPRAVRHIVNTPADVNKLEHLYCPPGKDETEWFSKRMMKVKEFSDTHGIPVQAWTGFGMDAAVWFTGTEKAILMSLDEPEAFHKMMDIITRTDLARTELAASHSAVDIVVERGWYSSTDFWSPALFDEYLFSHIQQLAAMAHKYGKKFGYVMTTGVEVLGLRLADAGVDVLYFIDPIDPVQGGSDLMKIRNTLGDRMTLVGGVSSISLKGGAYEKLEKEVRESLEIFSETNRFILHPVDAVFPDTPWEGIEELIEIWKRYR